MRWWGLGYALSVVRLDQEPSTGHQCLRGGGGDKKDEPDTACVVVVLHAGLAWRLDPIFSHKSPARKEGGDDKDAERLMFFNR